MNPYDQFTPQTNGQASGQAGGNPYDQFSSDDPTSGTVKTAVDTASLPFRNGWGDNTPSSFSDGVEAFNRQFGRMSEGVLQLVGSATGWKSLQDRVKEVHDSNEASYQEARSRSPIATGVGNVVGGLGSAVAYGGPSVGAGTSMLGKMAANGVGTAIQNGLEYADTDEERLNKTLVGGELGAAIPVLGKVLGSTAKAVTPAAGKLAKLPLDVGASIIEHNTGLPAKNFVNDTVEKLAAKLAPKIENTSEVVDTTIKDILSQGTMREVSKTLSGYLAPLLNEKQ